jgi:hypothetical protein
MSHFAYALLLAVLISAALAFLGRRTVGERVYFAACVFFGSMFAVVAGSWIMFLIEC